MEFGQTSHREFSARHLVLSNVVLQELTVPFTQDYTLSFPNRHPSCWSLHGLINVTFLKLMLAQHSLGGMTDNETGNSERVCIWQLRGNICSFTINNRPNGKDIMVHFEMSIILC